MATSATVTDNVVKAKKELTTFLKTLETVPLQILSEEAPIILAEAQAEAPFKTGALENSIFVRVSRNKKNPGINVGASVKNLAGYDYAGIQHEDTDFKHPIKGKAHFISDPFRRGIKRIERRLDKEVHM